MPLTVPTIDDRNYQEILNEVLTRIPAHTPEWTNFDDSDPGVTLLQLFAFMTESIVYRTNLIPERVQRKFIKLLDIPMQAATPAQGFVTFDNQKGPLRAETLLAGTQVQAGAVNFRTLQGLEVLPLEAHLYTKEPVAEGRKAEVEDLYSQLYASYGLEGQTQLAYYETRPVPQPTIGAAMPRIDLALTQDKAMWMALLAPKAQDLAQLPDQIANKTLSIGVLPALEKAAKVLTSQKNRADASPSLLVFDTPVGEFKNGDLVRSNGNGDPIIKFSPLQTRPFGDLLSEPGLVEVTLPSVDEMTWRDVIDNLDPLEQGVGNLPPSIEDTNIANRVLMWIRIRVKTPEEIVSKVNLAISWIGINATQVEQRIDVRSEEIGRGTGEPNQIYRLVNTPVLPNSVQIAVNNELWSSIDDIHNATPETSTHDSSEIPSIPQSKADVAASKRFQLDPESGEIRFGSGMYGARPARQSVIRASYSYGGGRAGNVGIGAISKGTLPAGTKVTNPIRTWGGSDPESIEDAQERMSQILKNRERLVSKSDFEEIVRNTPGVDLGRVEILPLLHPAMPDTTAQGSVTTMVIPRYDPINPDAPVPDQFFLDTVCQFLNPRRLITTEVHVVGATYVDIWVSVGFEPILGVATAPVRDAIKATIERFLSPLVGGYNGAGWSLDKNVTASELLVVAARVPGVASVSPVLLTSDGLSQRNEVTIRNLMLPRLKGIAVQVGSPLPLSDVSGLGTGAAFGGSGRDDDDTTGGIPVKPVPVVPEDCE